MSSSPALDPRAHDVVGDRRVTMLVPRTGWSSIELGELWKRRDLLLLWACRDISIRYKQTALGVLWAVIQPIVMMGVFTLFFGHMLGVSKSTGNVPYPVFVFAGLLPWTFFASSVTASSQSLVANASILTKVYFPRLLMPLGAVGAPLVDMAVSFIVLIGMMLITGVALGWSLLWVPVLVVLVMLSSLGVGIGFAALSVSYRDFRHVVPFVVQVLFFVTPVIYPVSVVPERWRWVLSLNPVTGPIQAMRAAVIGGVVDTRSLVISLSVSLTLLVIALGYFGRVERRFGDVV
ncbi:MAG: ABC transporter permease [Phycisphaera sp.]|nr:ABC transporter permease [Phycisphaera sp.]